MAAHLNEARPARVSGVFATVMLGMILLVVIGAIGAFGEGQAGMWSNIDKEMKAHGM